MRLNKNVMILLGAAVFLIILVFQAVTYFQGTSEFKKVNGELEQTQSKINLLQVDDLSQKKSDMKEELTQLEQQLKKAEKAFAEPFTSTKATKLILDVSDKVSLDVMAISSSAPQPETVDGVTYSAVSVTADVVGELDDIINLVAGINELLPIGIVRSVNIDVPPPPSANATTAVINIVGYTHGESE